MQRTDMEVIIEEGEKMTYRRYMMLYCDFLNRCNSVIFRPLYPLKDDIYKHVGFEFYKDNEYDEQLSRNM